MRAEIPPAGAGIMTAGVIWRPDPDGRRIRAILADGELVAVWRKGERIAWAAGNRGGISTEPSILCTARRLAVEARYRAEQQEARP